MQGFFEMHPRRGSGTGGFRRGGAASCSTLLTLRHLVSSVSTSRVFDPVVVVVATPAQFPSPHELPCDA